MRELKNQQTADVNPTTVTITLSVNEGNTPLKRQRLSDWVRKKNVTICV